ncbi:TrmB family transcriptional regulator [Natrialbaceae archaeon A-CW3]
MDRDHIRQALEHAGLTSYQADAYLTLLELGSAPAVEVGRKSSVPVSQIYDVLRDLEAREYIETMEREKLYAQPRQPEAILEELTDRGQLLTDAAQEIDERYQQPGTMDYRLSVTKHAETVVKHAIELVEEAAIVVDLAATVEQLEEMIPELRIARERGVVIRATVYTTTDDVTIDREKLEGAISELRVCSIPGPFLVTIDRHRTCFAPNTRSDETYGVLVHDRILPFIFHWYFLTCLWNLFPTVYLDDPETITYVTIEEFFCDFYELSQDGYRLDVRIRGADVDTDSETTVTGTVESMQYTWMDRTTTQPTLAELGAYTTMVVDTGEKTVSVGGWGAVFEDIEARRIDLVGVSDD